MEPFLPKVAAKRRNLVPIRSLSVTVPKATNAPTVPLSNTLLQKVSLPSKETNAEAEISLTNAPKVPLSNTLLQKVSLPSKETNAEAEISSSDAPKVALSNTLLQNRSSPSLDPNFVAEVSKSSNRPFLQHNLPPTKEHYANLPQSERRRPSLPPPGLTRKISAPPGLSRQIPPVVANQNFKPPTSPFEEDLWDSQVDMSRPRFVFGQTITQNGCIIDQIQPEARKPKKSSKTTGVWASTKPTSLAPRF